MSNSFCDRNENVKTKKIDMFFFFKRKIFELLFISKVDFKKQKQKKLFNVDNHLCVEDSFDNTTFHRGKQVYRHYFSSFSIHSRLYLYLYLQNQNHPDEIVQFDELDSFDNMSHRMDMLDELLLLFYFSLSVVFQLNQLNQNQWH